MGVCPATQDSAGREAGWQMPRGLRNGHGQHWCFLVSQSLQAHLVPSPPPLRAGQALRVSLLILCRLLLTLPLSNGPGLPSALSTPPSTPSSQTTHSRGFSHQLDAPQRCTLSHSFSSAPVLSV